MHMELVFLEDNKQGLPYTLYITFFQYRLPGNLEQSIQSRYFYLAVAPMLVVVAQELYFQNNNEFHILVRIYIVIYIMP